MDKKKVGESKSPKVHTDDASEDFPIENDESENPSTPQAGTTKTVKVTVLDKSGVKRKIKISRQIKSLNKIEVPTLPPSSAILDESSEPEKEVYVNKNFMYIHLLFSYAKYIDIFVFMVFDSAPKTKHQPAEKTVSEAKTKEKRPSSPPKEQKKLSEAIPIAPIESNLQSNVEEDSEVLIPEQSFLTSALDDEPKNKKRRIKVLTGTYRKFFDLIALNTELEDTGSSVSPTDSSGEHQGDEDESHPDMNWISQDGTDEEPDAENAKIDNQKFEKVLEPSVDMSHLGPKPLPLLH
ncbi:hypothetical protein Fcan01_07313 [Folsomia candida]|uniref:Uncharacterized protein n=1 Tax=Folsomia candida TaxID=158441 RepID=A0A226ELR1_FOLCA|nr:hypothetical protein Fcan01_07313 [Folsomia candida]